MVFLKDSAVFGIQLKMSSITILLLILLPFSTYEFDCPKNSSCKCTPSSTTSSEYRIYCSQDKSAGADFNVTIQSTKCINVECQNSHDWISFLTGNKLDLKHVDRLILSGCELPKAEYIDRPFDDARVKFLKMDGFKSRVSKQRLNTFPGLQMLVLSNNYLGQVDADLLYGQHNLTKLDLSATQIQLPPQFFVKSKSLTYLDLSNNSLRNLEPGVFDGLDNLRTLNLSHNNFDFLQPKLFRDLSSLGFLDLSESLLYALPNDIFRDTINLTFVNLSGNQFISIPENLFFHGLNKLKFVRLAHNKLNMTQLPSRLFSNLSSLKVLSLVRLNMRQLSKDQFRGLVSIVELDLSENVLETLPVDLLRDTRELRTFDASSNKLQALPDEFFVRTDKLMKLDLSRNRILALNRHFSEGLQALLEINLEDNELEYLHSKAFSSLRHLKIAKLSRNRLTFRSYIPETRSPLRHCSRLEELDLSRNEIAEMFADWVRSHDRLRKLDLSYNNLRNIELENLEFASKRLSLDLSHNSIAIVNVSLSYLRNHSREMTINLNENPIDCYCDVYPLQHYAANISAFKRIRLLVDNVTCNDPPSLRGAQLSELNDAKLECTSSNGRSKFCVSEATCDCSILPANRTLSIDCARRNLTEAPSWIGAWNDLHVSLDLSGNVLTRVPSMKSNGYNGVRSLNLADNRIASIDENLISANLRRLHLERNNLTSIDANLTKTLTESVDTLWLSGNPWLCDNTTLAFRRFVEQHKFTAIANYRDVVCADELRELLFRKPMDMFDLSELLARGLGALLLVATVLFLFLASLVYVLSNFLHVAAANDMPKFDYVYDAFVSFCDDDRDFVKNELATRLEAGLKPYKLCVRGRDWSCRSAIDIENVVEKSSRVIVVLSRGFFDYQLSCLELQTARDGGSRMIYVVRGELDDRVRVLLRTMKQRDRCVRWGDQCFWEKLYAAMSSRR